MNLLIVDDEIITINGIRKGIRWQELSFENVFSGISTEEAKEILSQTPIDIMVCDIEMPGENGLQLLEWIRQHGYDTECIFLTCHDEFQFAQKALKLNGMDYLLKPVPYEELQAVLERAALKVEAKLLDNRYKEYGRSRVKECQELAEPQARNARAVVEEVKDYINSHLEEALSADLLAKHVFVSTAYLFQIFKKYENMTLVEYITNTRLFYAAELLKDSEITVGRAAITVGYNNYCYFTKVFKKAYGVTPTQYQREQERKITRDNDKHPECYKN